MAKVSIVTTVKAPFDSICHYLDHHLRIGAHRIYLFLDDSEPVSVQALRQKYPQGVVVHDCDASYWRDTHGIGRPDDVETRQRKNADYALSLAREAHEDWIAHLDIDEYVHVDGARLPAVLDAMPEAVRVVRMDVLEAIPQALELENVSDIRFFKSIPFSVPLNDADYPLTERVRRWIVLRFDQALFAFGKALGISAARQGFHNFYNAHVMGKSITRVSGEVTALRLHFPWHVEGTDVQVRATRHCRMMHFESCSFSEWVTKWRRRSSREGFAAALDRRQKVIFDDFAACEGDRTKLEDLYRRLYFYSAAELEWLRRLRLVETIDP
jgi:hypothetical protein